MALAAMLGGSLGVIGGIVVRLYLEAKYLRVSICQLFWFAHTYQGPSL